SDLVLRRREAASKDESGFRGHPRGLDHPSRCRLCVLLRMRVSESKRTQFAWSLAAGAAPPVARCAGPAVQPGQPTKTGVTSIDGATVSLAAFENSAFPYHGMIPNYQE